VEVENVFISPNQVQFAVFILNTYQKVVK